MVRTAIVTVRVTASLCSVCGLYAVFVETGYECGLLFFA